MPKARAPKLIPIPDVIRYLMGEVRLSRRKANSWVKKHFPTQYAAYHREQKGRQPR